MTSPFPLVLLVRPQLGENIGAVARAMSNFGLSELRICAPRDGWPNRKALDMASGARPIIEAAKVYPDFASATADIHIAYATTARPRDMEKRVVTPDVAMAEILGMWGYGDGKIRGSVSPHPHIPNSPYLQVALVFGPERTGLENEEIAWCDTLITIPTAPENSSLNLAQSAVILGYEWWKKGSEFRIQSSDEKTEAIPELRTPNPEPSATKSDWSGLFGQLESYLDDINYYRVAEKKAVMWQNLRNMLLRGQWSEQEVRTFRGMLRAVWERKRRNE